MAFAFRRAMHLSSNWRRGPTSQRSSSRPALPFPSTTTRFRCGSMGDAKDEYATIATWSGAVWRTFGPDRRSRSAYSAWLGRGRPTLAGWTRAAVREINDAGGIVGSHSSRGPSTAADPQRAAAAVDELAGLGVAALAGEYDSVVARAAAARADALGLPFLCSFRGSRRTRRTPTERVARLAPAQSHGWQIDGDFLLARATVESPSAESGLYWASGARILRDYLLHAAASYRTRHAGARPHGHGTTRRQSRDSPPSSRRPPGAGSVDRHVCPPRPAPRRDHDWCSAGNRFARWATSLGDESAAIPFLATCPSG